MRMRGRDEGRREVKVIGQCGAQSSKQRVVMSGVRTCLS